MSSPGEQLASIETLPPPHQQALTAQKTDRLATEQSAIAAQAAEDARLLNEQPAFRANTLNAQAAALDAAARKRQLAAELTRTNSLLARRHVAATQTSLFASPDTAAVAIPSDQQQVALNQTEAGIEPSQTMDASRNSIYAGQPDQQARETSSIPLPDAHKVSEVQDLALAGKQVPPDMEVASADPGAADQAAALQARPAEEQAGEDRGLDTVPSYNAALADVRKEQTEDAPRKHRLTLADIFFGGARKTGRFDGDRFGNKRPVDTQAIPNMRTASLSDTALPGVTTTAMLPTHTPSEDDIEDSDDDQPAGLMKLASLPGMTRMAPNGLWVQNPLVDVSCLRPQLVSMLKQVGDHYGRPVVVTSGYRNPGHNRLVGGARHSLHTLCAAADIQIDGVSKWELADYLRSIPGRGGVGTYCHTESVHIDLGSERDWNWRCRRRRHS